MSMLQFDERIVKACGKLELDINTIYEEFKDVDFEDLEFRDTLHVCNECLTRPLSDIKRTDAHLNNNHDVLAAYNLYTSFRVFMHMNPDIFKEEQNKYDAHSAMCFSATYHESYEILVLLVQIRRPFNLGECLARVLMYPSHKKYIRLFLDYGANSYYTTLRLDVSIVIVQRACEYYSSRRACREACWALLSVRKRGGTLQGANGRDAMSLVAKYLWVHRFKKIWYAKSLMKKIKL